MSGHLRGNYAAARRVTTRMGCSRGKGRASSNCAQGSQAIETIGCDIEDALPGIRIGDALRNRAGTCEPVASLLAQSARVSVRGSERAAFALFAADLGEMDRYL